MLIAVDGLQLAVILMLYGLHSLAKCFYSSMKPVNWKSKSATPLRRCGECKSFGRVNDKMSISRPKMMGNCGRLIDSLPISRRNGVGHASWPDHESRPRLLEDERCGGGEVAVGIAGVTAIWRQRQSADPNPANNQAS